MWLPWPIYPASRHSRFCLGAGRPSPLHYLDTLRLVQTKGKNLHITLAPDEVEPALSLLSARGLFIETNCASEAQARHLLKMAEEWSRPG